MSSLEELERRIAAIEERLNVESGLRASGNRDLADMAQTLRAQQHEKCLRPVDRVGKGVPSR